MKVEVKNVGDIPVERLGYYFFPGNSKEVEVHPAHLHLIGACKHLEFDILEDNEPVPPVELSDDEGDKKASNAKYAEDKKASEKAKKETKKPRKGKN